MSSLDAVLSFIGCRTPAAWLAQANAHIDLLLIDHAHCEKKAAQTAISLLHRYPERADLQHQLSRLAREELRHYEQVLELMQERNVAFRALTPARYGNGLHAHLRAHEPARLTDIMIVGALIEARSCERFAALADVVEDAALARYYRFLLRSESRHFENYLRLAEATSPGDLAPRIAELRAIENQLICDPDTRYRFHSGVPVANETDFAAA